MLTFLTLSNLHVTVALDDLSQSLHLFEDDYFFCICQLVSFKSVSTYASVFLSGVIHLLFISTLNTNKAFKQIVSLDGLVAYLRFHLRVDANGKVFMKATLLLSEMEHS